MEIDKKKKRKISVHKGKTYEEEYGIKKSKSIKERKREKMLGKNKGTYEEKYGIKEAKLKKVHLSNLNKGKIPHNKGITFEKEYGIEKSDKIKNELSKKNKGITFKEKFGVKKANKIRDKKIKSMIGKNKGKKNSRLKKWTKEIIKSKLKIIQKENNGFITRKTIDELALGENKFICSSKGVRTIFGSIENLIQETGVKIYSIRNEDRNEHKWLNNIEKQQGIKIERQFPIGGYKLDGFCKEISQPFEYDEKYHNTKKQIFKDNDREIEVKDLIPGCKNFIRIKEDVYVLQKSHKLLSDFI